MTSEQIIVTKQDLEKLFPILENNVEMTEQEQIIENKRIAIISKEPIKIPPKGSRMDMVECKSCHREIYEYYNTTPASDDYGLCEECAGV